MRSILRVREIARNDMNNNNNNNNSRVSGDRSADLVMVYLLGNAVVNRNPKGFNLELSVL